MKNYCKNILLTENIVIASIPISKNMECKCMQQIKDRFLGRRRKKTRLKNIRFLTDSLCHFAPTLEVAQVVVVMPRVGDHSKFHTHSLHGISKTNDSN